MQQIIINHALNIVVNVGIDYQNYLQRKQDLILKKKIWIGQNGMVSNSRDQFFQL